METPPPHDGLELIPSLENQHNNNDIKMEEGTSGEKDDVFRSMKVANSSKTPYSDATQVGRLSNDLGSTLWYGVATTRKNDLGVFCCCCDRLCNK